VIRIEDVPGHPDFRPLDSLAHGIEVDLRYASDDNFVGHPVYQGLDCRWLRREAAEALETAAAWLARERPGYRLLVLDALRPQRVQQRLWDELAGTPLTMYLANPEVGSIHSYGRAVDLTLLGPDGREVDMGTGFDEMTIASHPDHEVELMAQGALRPEHLVERGWLRAAMREGGFSGIPTEWWHFDLGNKAQVRRELPRVL
jgi:D-alanyl-D-alanine dipeptidase